MHIKLLLLPFLLLCCFGCRQEKNNAAKDEAETATMTFDPAQWRVKKDGNYPYRESMVDDLLYNDTIRSFDKTEILALLGEPDRASEGYLYYLVKQKRLGLWPLHTKFLVIKLTADDTIEWIKTHE